jgi:hypothetical protein
MITLNKKDWVIVCPKCDSENHRPFVMYYGDCCFNCDFDIRTYINNVSYKLTLKGE